MRNEERSKKKTPVIHCLILYVSRAPALGISPSFSGSHRSTSVRLAWKQLVWVVFILVWNTSYELFHTSWKQLVWVFIRVENNSGLQTTRMSSTHISSALVTLHSAGYFMQLSFFHISRYETDWLLYNLFAYIHRTRIVTSTNLHGFWKLMFSFPCLNFGNGCVK